MILQFCGSILAAMFENSFGDSLSELIIASIVNQTWNVAG